MGDRPEMLFDLESDPGEIHNLAYEDVHRDVLLKYRQLLQQRLRNTDDDYLTRFGVPEN